MNRTFEKLTSYAFQNRLWIAAIVFSTFLVTVFLRIGLQDRQRDFTSYYFAAKAYNLGLNPYDTAALSSLAASEIRRPFLYPPISLHLMKFFSLFEYDVGYQVFLFMKIAFTAGLIFVWGKYFCENATEKTLMLVLAAISYDLALVRDLNAGNISVFEQFFFWIGFAALLRTQYFMFAFFLILGSLMKPLNLLVLVPLAMLLGKQHWRIFSLVLLVSAFLHGLCILLEPGIFNEFLQHAYLPDERGFMNPSSYAVSRELVDLVQYALNAQTTALHLLLYGGFVSVVLVLCFLALKKLDMRGGLMLSLFAYAIIAPRFKDYSYILLIVPSLFILTRRSLSLGLRGFFALIACTHFVAYQSFIVALWFFGTYVYYSLARKSISLDNMVTLSS